MNSPLEPQDSPTLPEPQTKPRPKRRFRRVLTFLTSLLIVALILVIAARQYINRELSPVSSVRQAGEFEVLPGWGGKRVALELERSGLIRNAQIFGYYLQFKDLDTQIGEGLYDLDPSMSSAEIASALAKGGKPRTVRIVIPEGFRLQDVAQRLSQTSIADAGTWDSLLHYPDHSVFSLIPEGSSFEGFLFPASYDIPLKSAAFEVLKQMYARFEQELSEEVKTELADQGLSVYDWVTLASIIQAEAANASEMPIIAGVFRNRLDLGMALQSDPTVAYGLQKDLPELSAPAGDFEIDHPWNTYTRAGLPAGPIDNPGSEALYAVLHPQRQNENSQDYLYFLHGFDGDQKVFRPNTDLAGHNQDVARYLR